MRRLTAALLFLAAVRLEAAIAFVGSAVGMGSADQVVVTLTLNGTGANYLIAGVTANDATNAPTISSIVYDQGTPQAMTLITSETVNITNKDTTWLYGLAAPHGGTNDLKITFANTVHRVGAWARMLSGVDQGTPTDTPNSGQVNPGTTLTVTIVSGSGGMVIDYLGYRGGGVTAHNGTTVFTSEVPSTEYSFSSWQAGAASVDASYTFSSTIAELVGVSLIPAGGYSATGRRRSHAVIGWLMAAPGEILAALLGGR